MHTFGETGAGVPAFLAKLWRLVEDPETNNLICWSKDGRSFIIQNQAQFARELLPLNYKHNNMASFIRQLNMYGFHKITSIDNGGLKFDRDEMEFTHPCFKRNCPYLLEHIKRKIASTKTVDEKTAVRPEAVTKVLQDVKAMRGRQDSLDSRFSVMKQENEALWREIASLRQKHAKQQQIVNKLIQFLITIVQPQRNMTSVKRHMQLMINDKPGKSKIRNTSESESECGPVIHELGEELMDEVSEVEPELAMPNSPFARVATPSTSTTDYDAKHSPHNIERPLSSISTISQNFDFSNQSTEDSVANAADGVNVGFVSTVNNDGSEIFYHITEVPDAQPQEINASPISYNEDDVLTTPMVREEMARSQLLKQTNRQRRNKNSGSVEKRINEVGPTSSKVQRLQSLKQQQNITQEVPQPMRIKAEHDTAAADPMLFLNVYPNDRDLTRSPNFSEDLLQSTASNILGSSITSPKNTTSSPEDDDFLRSNSSDLYNANSFIVNDIPADIFEDNSLASVEERRKGVQQEQLNNNRKFSTYLLEGNGSIQPSTSAAAAAAAANASTENGNKNKNDIQKPSQSKLKNENGSNLPLAKYKDNQEFMPLSTADDVSGHIDNVQDELEDLKDLLRSGYALDNNTLLGMSLNQINAVQNVKCNNIENNKQQLYLPPAMEEDILNKLFSDADILGSYGLHLSSTTESGGNNNKKDSELMACPPIMYDLSEMINDQDDLDADVNMPTTSTVSSQQQSKQEFNNSVLNTPYHE